MMEMLQEGMLSTMGVGMLLASAFEMLQHALKKMDEEKKEASKINDDYYDAMLKVVGVTEKHRVANMEATEAQVAFYRKLKESTQDAIENAFKLAEALDKANRKSFEDVQTGKHKAQADAIDMMEQRGVLSHETATKMKEQLDMAYERRKIQMMIDTDQMEINMLAKRAKADQDHADQQAKKSDDLAKQHKAANDAVISNDDKIAAAQEQQRAGKEALSKLDTQGVNADSIQKVRDTFTEMMTKTSNRGLFAAMMLGTGAHVDTASTSQMVTFFDRLRFTGGKQVSDAFNTLGLHGMEGITAAGAMGSQGAQNVQTYENRQADIKKAESDIQKYRDAQVDLVNTEKELAEQLERARNKAETSADHAEATAQQLSDKTQEFAVEVTGAIKKFNQTMATYQVENTPSAQRYIANVARFVGPAAAVNAQGGLVDQVAGGMSTDADTFTNAGSRFGTMGFQNRGQYGQPVQAQFDVSGQSGPMADFAGYSGGKGQPTIGDLLQKLHYSEAQRQQVIAMWSKDKDGESDVWKALMDIKAKQDRTGT